jgi:hypothetical protein
MSLKSMQYKTDGKTNTNAGQTGLRESVLKIVFLIRKQELKRTTLKQLIFFSGRGRCTQLITIYINLTLKQNMIMGEAVIKSGVSPSTCIIILFQKNKTFFPQITGIFSEHT